MEFPMYRKSGQAVFGLTALLVVVACALAPPAFGQLAGAGDAAITADYSFDRPEVVEVMLGGTRYHRVSMPNCPNGGDIGQPALPAMGARILLPFGAAVSSIEVVPGERVLLGSGFFVEPVGYPVKLSDGREAVKPLTPDMLIYGSDEAFPQTRFVDVGTFGFRGYQILTLRLQPVEYVPSTGELYYYPQLTVVVNTVDTGEVSALFRGLPKDVAEVVGKVDNPEVANTYTKPGPLGGRGYDLLILTTSALSSSFQPLKSYHDANGIMTEIHTTADVGSTDPDDIRAYITTAYQSDGIGYVIIGADDDIIPAKNLYVQAWAGGDVETAMPGDIYFGCLDGTWNYDGDSYWGEPTDGDGGGDVDLVAEVYVGRAAVGNTTEATRFVDKVLWYLGGGHSRPEKVLMVGEYLGFGGVSDYAGNMMDQIIDGSSADGYTTVGIPSGIYDIDTLYERDGSWSQSDLVTRINAGLHVINHLGHGSPDYAMKLYDSDIIADLTNDDLCFVYSQTCLAGHFDGTDCWAEYMNIKTDNGGFGVVMNARYGWGSSYSTDGPSQRFDREFWDAVFGEGLQQLGPANHDSKEDNIYRISDSCMRWCTYELNLFGDPTVRIQGVELPLQISFPAGLPTVLTPGEDTDISVQIDPGDEAYVSGSGTLHYRYDGGTYLTSALTHVGGYLYQATLPPADCDDTPEFFFSAEGTVSGVVYEPAGAPGSTYTADVGELVVIFEDAFESDQGWTVYAGADTGNWERADPQEVDSGGTITQPGDDHTASGTLCYVTGPLAGSGAGSYDVDGGPSRLTSPVFDLEDTDAVVSYWRWYHISTVLDDELLVQVSNGGSWVTVESITNRETWTYAEWSVSDYVTPTATVQVRFVVDDSPNNSLVEALIDDFKVEVLTCTPQNEVGDLNCDGAINGFDIDPFVLVIGSEPPYTDYYSQYPDCDHMLADTNGDGVVNGFDIDAFVALLGG
ncbi:MAG: hypothetical protein KKB50_01960 [Planctomycetes bacterium]|nr:hypothetical protein [Planctomycetota bacterium]